ncbi:helix-turn-helix domain-containing protein [Streptomyces sp. NPDC057702]|uniref:helix-turn-helix domain-containing protein n=1 Tax=unclassified Streptomyces TaxID=2593676 RepID=UPI003697794F
MPVVAVLVLDGVPASQVTAASLVLGHASRTLPRRLRYDLRLCSATSAPRAVTTGGPGPVRIAVDRGLDGLAEAGTVIVAGYPDVHAAPSAEVVEAVRAAADRGARIGAIGTGVFLLAAAGPLAGRRATTCWQHASELARRHPHVTVVPEESLVVDGPVVTSAGVLGGKELYLHVVARDHGEEAGTEADRQLFLALPLPTDTPGADGPPSPGGEGRPDEEGRHRARPGEATEGGPGAGASPRTRDGASGGPRGDAGPDRGAGSGGGAGGEAGPGPGAGSGGEAGPGPDNGPSGADGARPDPDSGPNGGEGPVTGADPGAEESLGADGGTIHGAGAVEATLAWMEANLQRPLTLAEIADHAGTSVRGLNRHVHARVGLSPLQYLLRARVRRAQWLLERTDLPVGRIATQTGLGTPANLRHHFRHHNGTTPGTYRAAYRSLAGMFAAASRPDDPEPELPTENRNPAETGEPAEAEEPAGIAEPREPGGTGASGPPG